MKKIKIIKLIPYSVLLILPSNEKGALNIFFFSEKLKSLSSTSSFIESSTFISSVISNSLLFTSEFVKIELLVNAL